jgi:HK97 family phage major capsid protein
MDPVKQLQDRLAELVAKQTTITQAALAASRPLTDDEMKELKENEAAQERLGEEIERFEKAAKAQAKILAPVPSPISSEVAAAKAGSSSTPPPTPGSGPSVTWQAEMSTKSPKGGFENAQAWFNAIKASAVRPDLVDHRLRAYAAATTYANEGTGPEGGWAQPPEFSKEIIEAVMGQASLLGRMRPMQSSSNIYQAPVDESTQWGTTGIQAAKNAEGAAATVSNIALGQRVVTLYKATALVNMTEELVSDNPATIQHVTRIMARQLQGIVERWLLRGSGMGEPVGILNAPALVSVAAEASGNGANTLIRQNLAKMAGRLVPGFDAEAFFVMSPSARIAANDVLLTAGGNTGDYLGRGPGPTILGYPVVVSMEAQAVGTAGDATAVAPSGFMTLVKGGVNSQATIFFYFDQGLTTLRSYIRLGQVPVLSSAVVPKLDTNTTLSHCVTTATRTG